jgi:hypothetical protein
MFSTYTTSHTQTGDQANQQDYYQQDQQVDQIVQIDKGSMRYQLPAYQAIVENPNKGLVPIATVVIISFLFLRWLMKG